MKTLICVVAVCITAIPLFGEISPSRFNSSRILSAPDTLAPEVGRFYLDADMYKKTNDALSDIRLFNAAGAEIPYVLRTAMENDTDTITYAIRMKTNNFKMLPDNKVIIVCERKKDDSIPCELELQTPLDNFEKIVSVAGSNDGKNWTTLADSSPVFDYSMHIDVRNTTVAFKKMAFLQYKILINNVWEEKQSAVSRIITEFEGKKETKKSVMFLLNKEPFRINEIVFSGISLVARSKKPRTCPYALSVAGISHDTANDTTTVLLASDKAPLRKLIVASSSTNFSRPVLIEGTNDTSDDEPEWTAITSANLVSIKAGSYSRKKLDILFDGPQRYLRYRLLIVNGDSPPIAVTSVSGEGDVHEMLFFHKNTREFRVYYCGADVEPAHYDISAVLAELPETPGAQWRLGTLVPVLSVPEKKSGINQKILLTALFFGMVVILGLVILVAVKKVESRGNDKEGEEKEDSR
jgi:hypothetical protein